MYNLYILHFFIMKIFITLILLFCQVLLFSQNKDYSFQQILFLDNTPKKIEYLNELAWQYRRMKPDSAYLFAEIADSIATIIQDTTGKANSYVRKGLLVSYRGDYQNAIDYYTKALKLRKSKQDWVGAANVLNNIALIYDKQYNYKLAETCYQDALCMLEYLEKPLKIRAKILNNLGSLYTKKEEYLTAIESFEQAIYEREQLNEFLKVGNVLLNQGNLFLKLSNYEKAEDCFLKGLKLVEKSNQESLKAKLYFNLGALFYQKNQFEEALNYCNKAIPLKHSLSVEELAIFNNNIGTILYKKGKIKKAKAYYLDNIKLFKTLEDDVKLARVLYNLGCIDILEKDYQEALSHLLEAHSLILNSTESLLISQISYKLSITYSNLEDFEKAYNFNENYSIIQDSLYQSHLNVNIYQRNQEENQKEIAQLKLQNSNLQLQSSEAKRQNQFYMGLGLLFFITLLGGIAAFVAYRNRQQQLIAEYQADQANSKIDDLLITQELNMANAKLTAKDETEQRIAKDLHDRLGAMLSTIKLYFNDVNEQLKTVKVETSQQHQKANELLDEACAEVRLIAHNMASGTLSKFGLIEGLKDLMTTINDSNQVKAKLYVYGLKERLDFETERKIYKIILELVSNALKHGKAKKLDIQLNQIEQELNIVVEDNGKGFKPEEIEQKSSGMGLRNITLRVADLNGRFHIDSGKGNGTTIAIDIPIQTDNKKI